ncbi:MAG: FAD-binding oxidoreductase [Burkholderiales bacterium]|nr:FAD-binding oxidoreductase [Burkholderiales bacterium]
MIGAGIVGICCASYLQRDGHDVTVIDRDEPGTGCSFGNAGLMSPSSIITAAQPGTWRNIPEWLLDPLGPLAIRWRHLPGMLPWLAAWLRSCHEENVKATSQALHALHAPVFESYAPLLAAAGAENLVRRTGQIYVSEREDGALGSALVRDIREAAGVRTEVLAGGAIRELEPALGPQYRSALFFPDNGHSVNSYRLVQVLAAQFRKSGGTLLRRTVEGFETGEHGPRRLLTDASPLDVDTLVIAAGAWSNRLARQLGMHFPLEAERGYHLMLPCPNVMPRLPIVNRDRNFTTTPMENGLRFAGTAEFAGLDAPPDYRRAHALLTHAKRMLPGLADGETTVWMGRRPSLPDALPVIDRAPRLSKVFLAFGHAHFGLTEASTTGRLIAELVGGRPPSIDPTPYRANRF